MHHNLTKSPRSAGRRLDIVGGLKHTLALLALFRVAAPELARDSCGHADPRWTEQSRRSWTSTLTVRMQEFHHV